MHGACPTASALGSRAGLGLVSAWTVGMAPGVALVIFKCSQNIHTVYFLQGISRIIKDLIAEFKTKE